MKKFKEKGLKAFLNYQFDEAIFDFSKEFLKEPSEEIIFLLNLSYYAKNHSGQALYKFEKYYQITKDFEKLNKLLDKSQISDFGDDFTQYENLKVISFKDFTTLIEKAGSFKEVYDKISFNTKIAFTYRQENFKFLELLLENGYYDTAMNIFDLYAEIYFGDEYLKKIGEKIYENKN